MNFAMAIRTKHNAFPNFFFNPINRIPLGNHFRNIMFLAPNFIMKVNRRNMIFSTLQTFKPRFIFQKPFINFKFSFSNLRHFSFFIFSIPFSSKATPFVCIFIWHQKSRCTTHINICIPYQYSPQSL